MIVSDRVNQIIVEDKYNVCLHNVDQDGQFPRNFNIYKTCELSVENEGILLVGFMELGEIKRYSINRNCK